MKSIAEIKSEFKKCDIDMLSDFIACYDNDERAGVRSIVASAEKQLGKYRAELERIKSISVYENECRANGYSVVAGIDEVGRGPLAGPVVACCVGLPKDCCILGINDSKKLSFKKREELFDVICKNALDIGIGIADNNVIDDINILQATFKAMREAVAQLKIKPDYILVDGSLAIPEINIPQRAIVKGDSKSISIGAASIVAKVTRDQMMIEYSKQYQGYGFESNMGYGSAKHIEAIKSKGLCPIHRKSFTGNFV